MKWIKGVCCRCGKPGDIPEIASTADGINDCKRCRARFDLIEKRRALRLRRKVGVK